MKLNRSNAFACEAIHSKPTAIKPARLFMAETPKTKHRETETETFDTTCRRNRRPRVALAIAAGRDSDVQRLIDSTKPPI